MAHSRSSGGQGAALAMAVPGLGRKFWTITSWTWPWRAWEAAMACRAASCPGRSSPMPTRIPVVKGMWSSPAASRVARRRAGSLSGRAAMRVEILRQRLDHHALAGRDGPQGGELLGEEGAGVGVGEEAGLLQYESAHVDEVVDSGGETVVLQPCLRQRVAQLGALAQGEERLVATGFLAGAGDAQDLLGGEVGGGEAGRRLGEGAVAAAVPAEHGERDEDLGRVGHPTPVSLVAHAAGQRRQVGQWHL